MYRYRHVQFIGYALPTIPAVENWIGWPWSVEGRYCGIEPATADIDARIEMVMKVLEQTRASGAVDHAESTLKIFVMPEFAFRGKRGAYDDDPLVDYFTYFRTRFAEQVASPFWKGWLFVVGTIVTAVGCVHGQDPLQDLKTGVREGIAVALANAWLYCTNNNDGALASTVGRMLNEFIEYCRKDPVFVVRDRCYIVAGGPPDPWHYPQGLSVQKKDESFEDFVLNVSGASCSEEDSAFPEVREDHGEDKRSAFDDYSIFTIEGIRFGIEICDDHLERRLRTYRRPDWELVQIQIVPSCGMEINEAAIIAGPGGYVFNCDGQWGGDNSSTGWTGAYNAHTQIMQVTTPCSPGLSGPQAQVTVPGSPPATVTIHDLDVSSLYSCGAGVVEVYPALPAPPPLLEEELEPGLAVGEAND